MKALLIAMREAAARGIGGRPDPLLQRAFALLAVGTAAGFWDFAEFGFDRCFGTHAQLGIEDRVRDGMTCSALPLLDMALGMGGAAARVLSDQSAR